MAEQSESGGEGGGGKVKAFLKKPIVWIGIGTIALFFIVRARMSAGGSSPAASPSPSFGGGGGGFSGGGSGESGIASGIQAQLDQLDLQQAQQSLKNEQALFDLNLQEKKNKDDLLAPLQKAWADTQTALQDALLSQVKATKSQCAHGDAKIDPETGKLYCRTPEGGGNKPFKSIGDAVSGVIDDAAKAGREYADAWITSQTGIPTGGGASQRTGSKSTGSSRSEGGMSTNPSGTTGGWPDTSGFPGLS